MWMTIIAVGLTNNLEKYPSFFFLCAKLEIYSGFVSVFCVPIGNMEYLTHLL